MKDSGIPWIGEIPKDWEIRKVKLLYRVFNGSTPKSDNTDFWDGEIKWITPVDMYNNQEIYASIKTITELGYKSCGTTIIPENSIILSTRAPIGQVSMNKVALCTNQGCKSLVLKNESYTKYHFYYFQVQTAVLNMLGRGTTFLELSTTDLNNYLLPVPPFQLQRQIANFLDEKCADIDQLITMQQQMIGELKAYKQSVITEAVCKGLDKSVPMKDSGIEWIGEVPERWICSKLKYNLSLINGRAYSQDELLSEGKYTILRVGNLFTNSSWYYSDMELTPDKYCDKGDLLYAWSASFGPQIWEGDKVIYHYHIWKVIVSFRLSLKMSYYILQALTATISSNAHGTAMQHITMERMNNSVIPIPPIEEQEKLVNYIELKSSQIDNLISIKQQKIDQLKEYKKSMIYEYITGKKQVPNK